MDEAKFVALSRTAGKYKEDPGVEVTIPKAVRLALDIKPGDVIDMTAKKVTLATRAEESV